MTSSFSFPSAPTNDGTTNNHASWIYSDLDDNDDVVLDMTLKVSLYGTDLITQDVIDSAVSWAIDSRITEGFYSPQRNACNDQDSCGFFFDGYVIEMEMTSTIGLSDTNTHYFCTMPLTMDQQDSLYNASSQWQLNEWGNDNKHWEMIAEKAFDTEDFDEKDLPIWQCGTSYGSFNMTPENYYDYSYYYFWDFDSDDGEKHSYLWLNDIAGQTEEYFANGFGNYKLDIESSTTNDDDEFTYLRFYQFQVEEPGHGKPNDWRFPVGTGRYHPGLTPVWVYLGNSDYSATTILNTDQSAIATAFMSASALMGLAAVLTI